VFTRWTGAPASNRSTSSADAAAEHAVVPEDPEVSRPRNRIFGREWNLVLLDVDVQRPELGDQPVELGFVEADVLQLSLDAQLLQDLGQGGQVPGRQLRRPVERDAQGRRLEVVDVELDHVAVRPSEPSHGDEPTVAADHPAGALLDNEGLGLAETAQAGLDGVQVLVPVLPGVRGVLVDRLQGDSGDRERVVQAGFQWAWPPRVKPDLES
jgi:hypothetical protein